jgi:hypothetical protein
MKDANLVTVHLDVLESPLVCLLGCAEVSPDISTFCTWPYLSPTVGGQYKYALVVTAH